MSDDSNGSLEDKSMITKILGEMKNEFNNKSTTTEIPDESTKTNGFMIKVEEIVKIEPELTECSDNEIINTNIQIESETKSKTRKKPNNKIVNTSVKRSTRRISKDYNESVLQSAIARKEKSYNETNKPQRLSRQLKPTQKILENIANAAALKQDKKKDKSRVNGLDKKVGDKNKNNSLKSKGSKRIKSNHCVDNEEKKVSPNKTRRLDKNLNNLGKSNKEENEIEVKEEKLNELELNSASAQLIASRLCVCSNKTNYYIKSEKSNIFCAAVDSIDSKLIGCSNLVNVEETPMVRPSTRVPYKVLCKIHYNRMSKHNCCPTCGVFCTQGQFAQCEYNHQYHRACQISVDEFDCCPHCSAVTPMNDISISIKTPILPKLYSKQKLHIISSETVCN